MNIAFDIFETLPELLDEMKPDEQQMFQTIIDFFEQRLSPLKQEIESQENKNEECVIMIHFLTEENNKRISMTGYSNTLKEKISGCFSDEDMIYLNNFLTDKWGGLNN
jgi:sulfur transfer protein SufE